MILYYAFLGGDQQCNVITERRHVAGAPASYSSVHLYQLQNHLRE